MVIKRLVFSLHHATKCFLISPVNHDNRKTKMPLSVINMLELSLPNSNNQRQERADEECHGDIRIDVEKGDIDTR